MWYQVILVGKVPVLRKSLIVSERSADRKQIENSATDKYTSHKGIPWLNESDKTGIRRARLLRNFQGAKRTTRILWIPQAYQ